MTADEGSRFRERLGQRNELALVKRVTFGLCSRLRHCKRANTASGPFQSVGPQLPSLRVGRALELAQHLLAMRNEKPEHLAHDGFVACSLGAEMCVIDR